MKKIKAFFIPWLLIGQILFLPIFFLPRMALAEDQPLPLEVSIKTASLFLLPDIASYFNPDYLYLDLIINPGEGIVNAIHSGINFDPTKLKYVNNIKEQSFCSFYNDELLNENTGYFSFSCGTNENFINSTTAIVRLTFQKLETGWTKLNILDESEVLAHDSLGSNILLSKETHNIYLTK